MLAALMGALFCTSIVAANEPQPKGGLWSWFTYFTGIQERVPNPNLLPVRVLIANLNHKNSLKPMSSLEGQILYLDSSRRSRGIYFVRKIDSRWTLILQRLHLEAEEWGEPKTYVGINPMALSFTTLNPVQGIQNRLRVHFTGSRGPHRTGDVLAVFENSDVLVDWTSGEGSSFDYPLLGLVNSQDLSI